MSGVISFAAGEKQRMWFGPGWCFNALLDHIIDSNRGDSEIIQLVEQGKYLNGLHMELIEKRSPHLRARLIAAIRAAAELGARGQYKIAVEGRELEEADQLRYQDKIELLSLLGSEAYS